MAKKLPTNELILYMILSTLKISYKIVKTEKLSNDQPPTLRITGKQDLLTEEEMSALRSAYVNALSGTGFPDPYHTEVKITGRKTA